MAKERYDRVYDTMEQGTKKLEESMRILGETEEIGNSTMSSLQTQKEQIIATRNKLGEVHEDINVSKYTLRNMICREHKFKIMTASIMVILVIIIALIIWDGN